ncbi:MAG: dTDP-4-dehydrorhamnose 3,5-epimerase [Actinomycetota bacterium]
MTEVRESEHVAGVYVVEPTVHGDERGAFVETYRREWIPGAREMIQTNRSTKQAGALVGLHYHLHQADYWYNPVGTIRAVVHDLRHGGPTDGATDVIELSDTNHVGLFIPPGVAHGFAAQTDVVMTYLVDGYYNPADELGVAWDDPDVWVGWTAGDGPTEGWGVENPVMSARDQQNPTRTDLPIDRRPTWPMRT